MRRQWRMNRKEGRKMRNGEEENEGGRMRKEENVVVHHATTSLPHCVHSISLTIYCAHWLPCALAICAPFPPPQPCQSLWPLTNMYLCFLVCIMNMKCVYKYVWRGKL